MRIIKKKGKPWSPIGLKKDGEIWKKSLMWWKSGEFGKMLKKNR